MRMNKQWFGRIFAPPLIRELECRLDWRLDCELASWCQQNISEYLYNFYHHILLEWLWLITQSSVWLHHTPCMACQRVWQLLWYMCEWLLSTLVSISIQKSFFMCCCFALFASINQSLVVNRNMTPHWFTTGQFFQLRDYLFLNECHLFRFSFIGKTNAPSPILRPTLTIQGGETFIT